MGEKQEMRSSVTCSNNGPKHFLPGTCTCQIMCHRKKGKKEGRQKGGKGGLWKEGRKNSLNTRKKKLSRVNIK